MLVEKKYCTGCGACFNICPKSAINMETYKDGFLYPEIDEKLCVNCKLCENVCPINSISDNQYINSAYAVKNTDDNIRYNSSSGGAFTAFAKSIIAKKGICFGAAFNQEFEIMHIPCFCEEDISFLRGSKYSQSSIGDTFSKVENALLDGKSVLFSGTPCQIAGLKSFLKKDYQNLLTIDFICHGVPSAVLWKKYMDFKKKSVKSEISDVSFRNKQNGWNTYSMKISYKNGKEEVNPVNEDAYLRAFLLNVFLRPSCYDCRFKNKNYHSDITLADFWGIDNILPNINDDKGVSLAVINTQKGKEAFDNVKAEFEAYQIDFDDALRGNPSYFKSCKYTLLNRFALRDTTRLEFEKLYKRYCSNNLFQRIVRKISKEIVKKF